MGDFLLWTRHQLEMMSDLLGPLRLWNRPSWTIDQIPDMTGKVVLVTGGNSGTGYCTSSALYRGGAKVYMACRNETKARAAIDRIERGLPCEGAYVAPGMDEWHRRDLLHGKPKGQLEFLHLDLEDLDSVKKAADHILLNEQRLDILYANAGIMMTPPGSYTKQGYSLQFGTNVLGHQRLISQLLPLLQNTSRANPESPARIIILSSAGHSMAPKSGVDYGVLCRPAEGDTETPRGLDPMVDYGMSKWGDIALAQHIHEHHGPGSGTKDGEILTAAIHPGIVATNLTAHLSGFQASLLAIIASFASVPPETGTINQLWAGTMPIDEARKISGKYIVPHHRVGTARPDLRNREAVERVWNWCEQEGRKHA